MGGTIFNAKLLEITSSNKINESKSVQVTFTNRPNICPSVTLNRLLVPQRDVAKYMGMYLEKRVTWRKHIFTNQSAMEQLV